MKTHAPIVLPTRPVSRIALVVTDVRTPDPYELSQDAGDVRADVEAGFAACEDPIDPGLVEAQARSAR